MRNIEKFSGFTFVRVLIIAFASRPMLLVNFVVAVGDPPNVLIVSAESLSERGINFGNFTMHLFPGAFLACLVGMATIRLLYRNVDLVTNEDLDSRSHRRELNTWKQAISRWVTDFPLKLVPKDNA